MQYSDALRASGRRGNQLRSLRISYDVFEHAAGSVLFEIGKTKILCAVTLQTGVPAFLKGKNSGWLTAEYAMLPASTTVRTQREGTSMRKNGRSIEISRLIGRSLRTVTDLHLLGERTIVIDCDVLQADGSTRTACITGACLALKAAQARWLKLKMINQNFLKAEIVAISVGTLNGKAILDLDYKEDSMSDADFNFIITRSGDIIEIQGGAEKSAVSWDLFNTMYVLAIQGAQQLFAHF